MRNSQAFLTLVAVFLLLGFFEVDSTSARGKEIKDSTPVVVAEDKTQEVDCQIWVDTENNINACPGGSVIFTREAVYREVREKGITYFAVLTGNTNRDDKVTDELAFRARSELAPSSASLLAACNPVNGKQIGGSYLSRPSDANSTRIFYEVRYNVDSACNVTNVSDRTRSGGEIFTWVRSCTGGQGSCTDHGITFDAVWTGWRGAINSRIDAQYTHTSYVNFITGRPYGWTFFVN